MKISFEIPAKLDLRFKRFLLDRYGTTYRVQQIELQRALELYLDREISTASASIEKEPKKEDLTARTKLKAPNVYNGKVPLELRDPKLAKEIIEYYGDGARGSGHSRAQTAEHFKLGQGQIDKVIRRNKK